MCRKTDITSKKQGIIKLIHCWELRKSWRHKTNKKLRNMNKISIKKTAFTNVTKRNLIQIKGVISKKTLKIGVRNIISDKICRIIKNID